MKCDRDCFENRRFVKGETFGEAISDSGRDCDELGERARAPVISARYAENLAAVAKVHLSAQTAGTSATINRGIERDAVARLKVTHVFAYVFDDSGCFVPHDDGWNTATGRTVVAVNIATADSTGGYTNEKFVGAESWDRKIGEFKMSVFG
jgi:hypothetical protein